MGKRSAKSVVASYLQAVNRDDTSTALAHLRDDFRLEFVGGPTLGKRELEQAMGWDRGTGGRIEWTLASESEYQVTIEGEETNDFLSLLGSKALGFRSEFEVDDAGLIVRQQHEVDGSGPPMEERLNPVVSWASVNAPETLEEVYPDGQLVYTEEMGRKWVRLLRAWRESEGSS